MNRSDSTVDRIVDATLDEKPPEPTNPAKSSRKATVVEIQTQAIATNRLCLPPSPEEDQ